MDEGMTDSILADISPLIGAPSFGQAHPPVTPEADVVVRIPWDRWNGSEWVSAGTFDWFPGTHLEVPTIYCFDCGQMVPITDTWTKKNDPNYVLCEACFRIAEGAGRAKEGA